jgi:hypothetical protein
LLSITGLAKLQGNIDSPVQLKLDVIPGKTSYVVGEVVYLSIKLSNVSEDKVAIINNWVIPSQGVKILVSNDLKTFNEYKGDKLIADGIGQRTTLSPTEDISTSRSVLWNDKPNLNGLNRDVAENAAKGRILTDYAFPSPGKYYVKASDVIHLNSRDQPNTVALESEPIEITIEEPAGVNLEVWNQIKDSCEFANFIQFGSPCIPVYKTNERVEFVKKVEHLLLNYPESFYTDSLRKSLEKFKETNAKLKKYRIQI